MFYFGRLVATRGVHELMETNSDFSKFVDNCFKKYLSNDWGDMCEEDLELNDEAIRKGDTRIFASYDCPLNEDWKIWIITEYDRSFTTILFPHEY